MSSRNNHLLIGTVLSANRGIGAPNCREIAFDTPSFRHSPRKRGIQKNRLPRMDPRIRWGWRMHENEFNPANKCELDIRQPIQRSGWTWGQ